MFQIDVNQPTVVTTNLAMQLNDLAVIDAANPGNPSNALGHLIIRTDGVNKPVFQCLTDVKMSWAITDTLYVDVLPAGTTITLNVTSGTQPAVTTQTWNVPVPAGMTTMDALAWVSNYATQSISVLPEGANLTVIAPIGAFTGCPGATLVS